MESLACQEQEEANLHLRCESISEEEGVEQAQREVCHNTIKRSFRKRTEQARKWAERRSKSGREDPP